METVPMKQEKNKMNEWDDDNPEAYPSIAQPVRQLVTEIQIVGPGLRDINEVQAGNKATEKKGWSKAHCTIGQSLKLGEVIVDCTSLMELEQCTMRVIIE